MSGGFVPQTLRAPTPQVTWFGDIHGRYRAAAAIAVMQKHRYVGLPAHCAGRRLSSIAIVLIVAVLMKRAWHSALPRLVSAVLRRGAVETTKTGDLRPGSSIEQTKVENPVRVIRQAALLREHPAPSTIHGNLSRNQQQQQFQAGGGQGRRIQIARMFNPAD